MPTFYLNFKQARQGFIEVLENGTEVLRTEARLGIDMLFSLQACEVRFQRAVFQLARARSQHAPLWPAPPTSMKEENRASFFCRVLMSSRAKGWLLQKVPTARLIFSSSPPLNYKTNPNTHRGESPRRPHWVKASAEMDPKLKYWQGQ